MELTKEEIALILRTREEAAAMERMLKEGAKRCQEGVEIRGTVYRVDIDDKTGNATVTYTRGDGTTNAGYLWTARAGRTGAMRAMAAVLNAESKVAAWSDTIQKCKDGHAVLDERQERHEGYIAETILELERREDMGDK